MILTSIVNKFQVIILAAGQGTRLLPLTKNMPKTMIKVNDKPIIDYILSSFDQDKIEEIIIATGHYANLVENHLGRSYLNIPIKYVRNDLHKETNSIYSLWLLKNFIKNDTIIINADTVIHKDIFTLIIESIYDTGLAIDDTLAPPLPDEAMKASIKDNIIYDVSKKILPEKTNGDAIGVYKFSQSNIKILFNEIDYLIENSVKDKLFTYAVQKILKKINIYSISTKGKPWIEIDDLNDLNNFKKMVENQEL